MNRKICTALTCSVLIGPGAGHYYLGLKRRALLFALISSTVMAVWLGVAIYQASLLLDGAITQNISMFSQHLTQISMRNEGFILPVCLGLFLIIWLWAIIETYQKSR